MLKTFLIVCVFVVLHCGVSGDVSDINDACMKTHGVSVSQLQTIRRTLNVPKTESYMNYIECFYKGEKMYKNGQIQYAKMVSILEPMYPNKARIFVDNCKNPSGKKDRKKIYNFVSCIANAVKALEQDEY